MIARVAGVLIEADDARFLLAALEALLVGRRPSARLSVFIERLRRSAATLTPAQGNSYGGVRDFGAEPDSGVFGTYDLVDSGEAARILRIGRAGARDLARRGRLPAHRAGGRWLYPARSVLALAEQRAAKREP